MHMKDGRDVSVTVGEVSDTARTSRPLPIFVLLPSPSSLCTYMVFFLYLSLLRVCVYIYIRHPPGLESFRWRSTLNYSKGWWWWPLVMVVVVAAAMAAVLLFRFFFFFFFHPLITLIYMCVILRVTYQKPQVEELEDARGNLASREKWIQKS